MHCNAALGDRARCGCLIVWEGHAGGAGVAAVLLRRWLRALALVRLGLCAGGRALVLVLLLLLLPLGPPLIMTILNCLAYCQLFATGDEEAGCLPLWTRTWSPDRVLPLRIAG